LKTSEISAVEFKDVARFEATMTVKKVAQVLPQDIQIRQWVDEEP